jgi:hypothetical protein
MAQPRSTEDDDLPPDLPRVDGAVDGEENFEPKDDSDFGLDEEKDVGLDMEAGLDEPLDGELDGGEEVGSWLDDGKEPAAVADDEGSEADGDDETNLTEGSESASDQNAEDWEDDFGFDDGSGADSDSGEEGFGDDGLLSGLDLDRLPPLDDSASNEEEPIEADPFGAEVIGELGAGVMDDDEATETLAPGLSATRISAARVRVELLLRSEQPLAQLIAAGDVGIAWDGRALLVADPQAPRPEPRFGGVDAVQALAAASAPEGAWIALATPSGLLCSRDAGRSFERRGLAQSSGMPELVSALAITASADRMRLWAAGAVGPLWVSDDGGLRFRCVQRDARVLRLGSDGATALVVLERGDRNRAAALLSRDHGEHFEPLELPVDAPERVQDLQIARDVVLCCRRAPAPQLHVWGDGDWSALAHAAAPPALALVEGATVWAYFWVGARLVRTTVDGTGAQIVAELPGDAGAPLQLCGHHAGAVTTLHAGTERAWYRIVVGPEGDGR